MPLLCGFFLLVAASGSRMAEDDAPAEEILCNDEAIPWLQDSWQRDSGYEVHWKPGYEVHWDHMNLSASCVGELKFQKRRGRTVSSPAATAHTKATTSDGTVSSPAAAAHTKATTSGGTVSNPAATAHTKATMSEAQGASRDLDEFTAKLTMTARDKNDRYNAEVELTNIIGQTHGLFVKLIQGAHAFQDMDSGGRHGQPYLTYMLAESVPTVSLGFLLDPDLEWRITEVRALEYQNTDEYLFRMLAAQMLDILVDLERASVLHLDIGPDSFVLTPPECKEAFRSIKVDEKKAADRATKIKNEQKKRRDIWRTSKCRIMLRNFGSACTYDEDVVKNHKRTMGCKRGGFVGKPGWASPEVSQQESRPFYTSDVFSVAVFLYLFRTGEYPQLQPSGDELRSIVKQQWKELSGEHSHEHGEGLSDDPDEQFYDRYLRQQTADNPRRREHLTEPLKSMLNKEPAQRPRPEVLYFHKWLDFEPAHAPEITADKNYYRNWASARAKEDWELFARQHQLEALPPANPLAEEQLDIAFEVLQMEEMAHMEEWRVFAERLEMEEAARQAAQNCSLEGIDAISTNASAIAEASPWFTDDQWKNEAPYTVEWQRVLGASCRGVTGHPSVLKFRPKPQSQAASVGSSRSTTKVHVQGGEFDAVFKKDEWDLSRRYVAEAELIQLFQTDIPNGLIVKLIQGAHTGLNPTMTGKAQAFLLTEVINGEDLVFFAEELYRNKDQYLFRMVSAQLVHILMALETAKVLHLDIKLGNLLLTPSVCVQAFRTPRTAADQRRARRIWNDNDCRIKLLDLGLACTYDTALVSKFHRAMGCKKGINSGTPGFASPEIYASSPSFTSDVFSTGILLYIIARGVFPQLDLAPKMNVEKSTQQKDASTAVNRFLAKWPEDIRKELEGMLKQKPEERPRASALWEESWLKFDFQHAPELEGVPGIDEEHYREKAREVAQHAWQAWVKFREGHKLAQLPAVNKLDEETFDAAFQKLKENEETRAINSWIQGQCSCGEQAPKKGKDVTRAVTNVAASVANFVCPCST